MKLNLLRDQRTLKNDLSGRLSPHIIPPIYIWLMIKFRSLILKATWIHTIVIAVDRGDIRLFELKEIATDPEKDLFRISSFDVLEQEIF